MAACSAITRKQLIQSNLQSLTLRTRTSSPKMQEQESCNAQALTTKGQAQKSINSKTHCNELYLSAETIRLPLVAAALLQSAVAGAFAKMSADLLRMAVEPLPDVGVPLDLSPPRKETPPSVTTNTDDSVTSEDDTEPADEPLALIKRPRLIERPEPRQIPVQQQNHHEQQQPARLIHPLQFAYALRYTPVAIMPPAVDTPSSPPQESDVPLDFSTPSEHACNYPGCNKSFRYNHALVNHYRVHTGERPYVCDFPGCTQAFARQSNLLTHRMIHLDRGMRRTFACPVPGCQKNFLKKTNLDDHMNLHLNKRPYGCDYPGCGKSFRCRSNLSGHKRVHAKEVCGTVVHEERPLRPKETPSGPTTTATTTSTPISLNLSSSCHPTPLERKIDSILARARASVAKRNAANSAAKNVALKPDPQ